MFRATDIGTPPYELVVVIPRIEKGIWTRSVVSQEEEVAPGLDAAWAECGGSGAAEGCEEGKAQGRSCMDGSSFIHTTCIWVSTVLFFLLSLGGGCGSAVTTLGDMRNGGSR